MGDVGDVCGVTFVLCAFAFVALLVTLGRGYTIGTQKYKTLDALCSDVSRLIGLPADREPGYYTQLANVRFTGRLPSGRGARVSFFTEQVGSSTNTYVRFSVDADEAPHLKVTPENVFHKIGKFLGLTREIEIGVPEFDSRFLLETRTERKAAKVLGPELRRAITAAFDRYRVRTLVLEDGRLTVDADISFIEPGEYPGVLGLLDRAARTMDRTKIKVRILGSERRALVDERGKTRCAYCHEGLTGDEDDLVACEQCATVLHGECWRTHGKCPILGCSGKNPERGRVRG